MFKIQYENIKLFLLSHFGSLVLNCKIVSQMQKTNIHQNLKTE